MPQRIYADRTASVTELKRDPMGTIAAADGHAIAILNRNQAAFYCVPVAEYEAMLDRLEDAELNALADERRDMAEVSVDLNAL